MKSESFLSDILNKYKTYRIASGRISNGYLDGLHKFERFCVKEYPSADKLSQEMIDKWCCKRKTEKTNSCLSRIYPVISLLRYTNSRNLTDLRIPLTPRPVPRVYIPHAFSEEELNNFSKHVIHLKRNMDWLGKYNESLFLSFLGFYIVVE